VLKRAPASRPASPIISCSLSGMREALMERPACSQEARGGEQQVALKHHGAIQVQDVEVVLRRINRVTTCRTCASALTDAPRHPGRLPT
jgi:hypothetical protein